MHDGLSRKNIAGLLLAGGISSLGTGLLAMEQGKDFIALQSEAAFRSIMNGPSPRNRTPILSELQAREKEYANLQDENTFLARKYDCIQGKLNEANRHNNCFIVMLQNLLETVEKLEKGFSEEQGKEK